MLRKSQVWSLSALLLAGCTGEGADDQGGTHAPASTTDTTEFGASTGTTDSTPDDPSGTTADPTAGATSGTSDDLPTGTTADPTTGTSGTSGTSGDPVDPVIELPPPDGDFDYQLGGAYGPPKGVQIVSRDRTDPPAPGLYNICYVNGFQSQPGDDKFWLDQHPDLVLRDGKGDPVIDEDWGEMLLDVGTPAKRAALAEIVGGWISGCGADGYDAIEIDNLDSYSRSKGLLTQDDAVAYMALLSQVAHAEGMAIAQKNSTELLDRVAEMGTDFAIAEECSTWDECEDYIDAYGDAVLMIEYIPADFAAGCAAFPQMSIVLRDLYLTTPDDPEYLREAC